LLKTELKTEAKDWRPGQIQKRKRWLQAALEHSGYA